jgi:hypothetical protein
MVDQQKCFTVHNRDVNSVTTKSHEQSRLSKSVYFNRFRIKIILV